MVLTPAATDPTERRASRYYREEDEANDAAVAARALIARQYGMTVEEAIDQYRTYLQEKGTGEISYRETTRRLKLFFPDLTLPISRVTSERAKSYYEAFRQRRKKNGDPISVDYHRCTLINARSFLSWSVEQGWLQVNPLASVKGVGRRNAGKQQHTGDETRKLYALCLARAESGDHAALGVLMALLMALRSGDITRRVVRDVDLDATVLRVYDGKTLKSNRPRKIPEVLQPMLRKLVDGRQPFEPLLRTPYTETGHHTRRWLEEAMVRFCKAADVPYVCPHALKGTAATLLAQTGELADRIADHLSHEEASTTAKHYVARGAIEQAQVTRAFAVIAGGRR